MLPNDDTEMCRHFLFPLLISCAHIFYGAVMVVMGARCSRGCRGVGSIPAHGSDKTNEEVLANLLTWESRPRETSSSQGWWGDSPALFLAA
jgi:hypothetical protein